MATYLLSVNFGASKSGQAANVRYSVRDSSPATRIAATNTGIAEKLDAAGTTGIGSYSAIVSIDDSGWTFPIEVLFTIVGQTGVGVVDTIYYSPSQVPAKLTTAEHTAIASDVQAGMTTQGYTTTRAQNLDLLPEIAGLAGKYQVMRNMTYDLFGNILTATVRVYNTSANAATDDGTTGLLYSYTLTNTFNGLAQITKSVQR